MRADRERRVPRRARSFLSACRNLGSRRAGTRCCAPEGRDTQDSPGPRYGTTGIHVVSANNVAIDHNEISGWALAGVWVWDDDQRIPPGSSTVRIHDNYIHHNQAVHGDGYGVSVGHGAYALIDRNVFDWNRHAIEGDGSSGTGYLAYNNLVLENGGRNRWYAGIWDYTHQFDMHGREDCVPILPDVVADLPHVPTQANCGLAGHSMHIRHNTFLYTEAAAIKLRGTPDVGMFVGGNVFAHDTLSDAVHQTESGVHIEAGNLTGVDASADLGSCDFDGDGIDDTFMATGATWWYSSANQMSWTYLNTSTKRLSEVSLGYVDGDDRCDVIADGVLYSGGAWRLLTAVAISPSVAAPLF